MTALTTTVKIGGWTTPITPPDIESRFKLPGVARVNSTYVKNNHAFVSLSLTPSETPETLLSKLKKLYDRTSWRGGKLELSLATPDYRHRLREEWAALAQAQMPPAPKLAQPPPSTLRIRKKRGRRGTILVPAADAFGTPNSDEPDDVSGAPFALPASQSSAYCCLGDAGPTRCDPPEQASTVSYRVPPPRKRRATPLAIQPAPRKSTPTALSSSDQSVPPERDTMNPQPPLPSPLRPRTIKKPTPTKKKPRKTAQPNPNPVALLGSDSSLMLAKHLLSSRSS